MSLIISKKYKYIFFHLPKNAGVSISRTLISQENTLKLKRIVSYFLRNYFQKHDNFYLLKKKKLIFFRSHITCSNFYNLMDGDICLDFFKFAVVRNPWDRMVSRYFYSKKISKKFINFSFNEFLNYDLKNNANVLNQYNFCTDNKDNFCLDKVIKFENLNEDFNKISSKIFNKKDMLSHFNKSDHKQYREYYNHKMKDKIYNFCKKDIEFFEYEF